MQSLKDKYDFIDKYRHIHSVSDLCQALNVSRSAYYNREQVGKRETKDLELYRLILEIHSQYKPMGLDSMYHFLKNQEIKIGRRRLHRIMKKYNIHSCRHKAFKCTTNSNHSKSIAPNLLHQYFNAHAPNVAWVGDITYIPTLEGWLYLAIVKDLCTKKIVGYSFSNRIDAKLVCDALNVALYRQRPPADLIFHSDRGSQYASDSFRALLNSHNIIQSMSRKGNPYDNAVAENFFSCLKCECVYLHSFITRSQAQSVIFRYIETYYNSIRPHSSINWLSPNAFEKSFNISRYSMIC